MHYFLLGPGGVGKSSVSIPLSKLISLPLVDLDNVYMGHGNISKDITEKGYQYYYNKNSKFFFELLSEISTPTIFVLSSGFLCYPDKDLVLKHITALQQYGKSIVLLPSENLKESAKVVVNRQLNRGFGLKKEREYEKFKKRFNIYKNAGDIQIYSCKTPKEIVKIISNNI